MPSPGPGRQSKTHQRLLVLLRERGAMSRAELARALGLSNSTVSTAIADLVAAGMVHRGRRHAAAGRQRGRAPGARGLAQPARRRRGRDLRRASGTCASSSPTSPTACSGRRSASCTQHTADEGLPAITDAVAEALDAGRVYRDRLLGAGVGLPGPIHRATGMPAPSMILPGWAAVHVAEELSARLRIPVAVDNEANLEALAELTWGAGHGCADMVYLKLHSGVGAGVVVNGQLARGAAGGAGELGHIVLDPSGPECWACSPPTHR